MIVKFGEKSFVFGLGPKFGSKNAQKQPPWRDDSQDAIAAHKPVTVRAAERSAG